MVGDDMEHQPRATTASIDRRVERLEVLQAETDRKVDSLVLTVDHLRELMGLKFTGIEQAMTAQGLKLDTFISRIDTLINEGLRQQADIDASPLGRAVNKRINELEKRAQTLVPGEELRDRLEKLETQQDEQGNVLAQFSGFGAGVRFYVLPTVAIVIAIVGFLHSVGVFP